MKKPTVTICIPVYKQAEFLPDAIESALAQTVPCEIIVVNDGSTDNSLEIAKKYPVKVISQTNRGLASARNTGIMNMMGDYFLPLDADDILMENAAERIIEVIKESKADVVAPSFKTFGTTNRTVILNVLPVLSDFLTANRIGYFSAIKKEVLLEIGGYNSKMVHGYEDYDIWIDIFKRGKVLAVIPEVLVLYRTKETSMLTEAQKHHEEIMEQMRWNHPGLPW